MNRAEFIRTIMELYPNTFNPNNETQYQGWVRRYKSSIPENWDFDKLLKIFDREWKSTVTPPHPSFFLEFRNDVKPEPKRVVEQIEISEEERKATEKKLKEYSEKFKKLVEQTKIDKISDE